MGRFGGHFRIVINDKLEDSIVVTNRIQRHPQIAMSILVAKLVAATLLSRRTILLVPLPKYSKFCGKHAQQWFNLLVTRSMT
eukprot:9288228-Prorocentrum_lima.AAC.1